MGTIARRLILVGLLTVLSAPAGAVPLAVGDFWKATLEEGFEGLVPGGEVGVQAGATGVYLPGLTGPYTFATGVTLFGVSTYVFPNDAFVHELSILGATPNDWGANGTVATSADVPFGSAYLGVFESDTDVASVEFSFPSPVNRVGAYVAGDAGSDVTIEVYGVGDVLLESLTIAAPSVADWGTASAFLGIQRAESITRVVFSGHDFGLDNLYFEALTPVPEPGTLVQLGLGLAALCGLRRPRGV